MLTHQLPAENLLGWQGILEGIFSHAYSRLGEKDGRLITVKRRHHERRYTVIVGDAEGSVNTLPRQLPD